MDAEPLAHEWEADLNTARHLSEFLVSAQHA